MKLLFHNSEKRKCKRETKGDLIHVNLSLFLFTFGDHLTILTYTEDILFCPGDRASPVRPVAQLQGIGRTTWRNRLKRGAGEATDAGRCNEGKESIH